MKRLAGRNKREALDKLVAEAQEAAEKGHQGVCTESPTVFVERLEEKTVYTDERQRWKLLTTGPDQGAR